MLRNIDDAHRAQTMMAATAIPTMNSWLWNAERFRLSMSTSTTGCRVSASRWPPRRPLICRVRGGCATHVNLGLGGAIHLRPTNSIETRGRFLTFDYG